MVLLPGLHGTGDLFAPFVQCAPPHLRPVVIPLPLFAEYDELLQAIRAQLPAEPFAILGESFSGPLAISIARAMPERVVAVILSASFVSPPISGLLRFVPWRFLFVFESPRWVVRWFFAGRKASRELVDAVRGAIRKTPRRVLAARMRAVFSLRPLAPISVPLLYLSGTRDVLVRFRERAFERVAPHVERKRIAAPHLVLQAAPREAWAAIAAFLDPLTRT